MRETALLLCGTNCSLSGRRAAAYIIVGRTSLSVAVDILVEGFFDNPVNVWIFPDASTRAEALESWFSFWIELYGDEGHLNVLGSGEAAALWATPDAPALDEVSLPDFLEIIRRYNGDRTTEILSGFAGFSPPKEKHWYLNAIATRVSARGSGHGLALVQPYVDRADHDDLGIYLESSNPRNLSFYYRLDFQSYGGRIVLSDDGAELQPMWRPAQ
jgi:GNAT superfamily N-acetyltransferase